MLNVTREHSDPSNAQLKAKAFVPPVPVIQKKLKIGAVDDPMEAEADAMADQVIQQKEVAIPPAPNKGALVQKKCSSCEEEELQKKPLAESITPLVQKRSLSDGGNTVASEGISNQIAASRGQGSSMDKGTQNFMENSFGTDFSEVNIHTDSNAIQLSKSLNAQAFTVGNDIYFNEGKYNPSTTSGKHLLAHELTHTLQQSASIQQKMIQMTPAESRNRWNQLVTSVSHVPDTDDRRSLGDRTITRFLETQPGQNLVDELYAKFCNSTRCTSHLEVIFKDNIPSGVDSAAGYFTPSTSGANQYQLYIKNVFPSNSSSRRLFGTWPGLPPDYSGPEIHEIRFYHNDVESAMASTLHHEATHVLFINDTTQRQYPTGHGDVLQGEIDPAFMRRMRAMHGALDELESIQNRTQQNPTTPNLDDIPSPNHRPSEEPETNEPSIVGGEFSFRAGGGWVEDGVGTGILGMDLTLALSQLDSLRIGARGVYLTPDRLFAGGTLGYRRYRDDSNPLFFDIEAGILREILPTETDRLSDAVMGFGSAGIGQEYGQEGPRFFWRLGGFVMISDRPLDSSGSSSQQVGGGPTLGAGLRL
ncbi:MAG: hypothetical protein Aureis2KO_25200 [Aureisphaera sp.]